MRDSIRVFLFIMLSWGLVSCQQTGRDSIYVDASDLTEMNVHIKRYGEALFSIDTAHFKEGLQRIQPLFPYFLDANLHDSTNIDQLYTFVSDSQTRRLYRETMKVYPDLDDPGNVA